NFTGAIFEKDADFHQVKFLDKANFSNARFNGNANFSRVQFPKNTSFHSTQFLGDTTFDWAKFTGRVDFMNTHFGKDANFFETQFEWYSDFRNSKFHGVAYFESAKFSGLANFIKAKFNNDSIFRAVTFSGDADYSEAQFLNNSVFFGTKFSSSAKFFRCIFSGEADLSWTQFKGETDFTEAEFKADTKFINVLVSGNIFFNSVISENVQLIDFYLSKFHKNCEFINVKLGKTSFRSVQFEQPANFSGSNLAETDFVGAVFKEFGLFNNCSIQVANRETFRIVKHELLKLNNKIEALIYHKKEMEVYWNEIRQGKWNGKITEKFILFMNCISNGYGLKWWRGVKFTIIVALLFFIPYVLCLKNPYFEWGWEGLPEFWSVSGQSIKYFVEFLYAAHSFNYMEQYEPRGFAYILDMVGRVFIAYGYYQTIQAFRKYGRW
ncbi:MAG: pentapeptide repeat-containing protein, partial [Bacteroidales bacterium]|nr:pentapeptide repeat-containing protein [Bacteroidales bacterium]